MTTPEDRLYAHRTGRHYVYRDPLCLLCHLKDKELKGTTESAGSLLREIPEGSPGPGAEDVGDEDQDR